MGVAADDLPFAVHLFSYYKSYRLTCSTHIVKLYGTLIQRRAHCSVNVRLAELTNVALNVKDSTHAPYL